MSQSEQGIIRDVVGTWLTVSLAEDRYGIPRHTLLYWQRNRAPFLGKKIRFRVDRVSTPNNGGKQSTIYFLEDDLEQIANGRQGQDVVIDADSTRWLTARVIKHHYGISRCMLLHRRSRPCSALDGRPLRWRHERVMVAGHGLHTSLPVYHEEDIKRIAESIEQANRIKQSNSDAEFEVSPAFAKRIAEGIAAGHTLRKACEVVGISHKAFCNWKRRVKNRQFYESILSKAMEKSVRAIRAAAGTDAVIEAPSSLLRRARAAEAWCDAKGEKLINIQGTTLHTFFEDYYLPVCLANVMETSKKNFRSAVRHWTYLTGDPPLQEITNVTLARFKDALSQRRGMQPGSLMSPTSVAKNLRHIQSILDKAGPPGRGNRDAAGILDKVPWVRPPKKRISPPRIVKPELLEQVYMAASAMDRPNITGCEPAAWWQALIVLAYNTGLRRRTLLELRMSDIDWDNSRLVIPGKRMKSGRPHIIHLNNTAKLHLSRIRTDRELVFEWPLSKTLLFRDFHRLQTLAEIPKEEHFGLHNIRKTVATLLWQESPEAAQLSLGHAGMAVTIGHYVRSEAIVANALDKLPQPKAFSLGAA